MAAAAMLALALVAVVAVFLVLRREDQEHDLRRGSSPHITGIEQDGAADARWSR